MPHREDYDIKDLVNALDALSNPCAIYRGSSGVVFANRAALANWPILYDELEGGVGVREAIFRQIASQYPDAAREKIAAMTDAGFEAMLQSGAIDIPAPSGRLLRTDYCPLPGGLILGISVDVTELRAREKDLGVALKAADAANLAKTDFLAKVTHEIRTPMNGVLGIVELLNQTQLDETQRLYVETIRNSSRALLGIVNEVLDLSRIESGAVEITLDAFDPRAVVREVMDLLTPSAQAEGIEISTSFAGGAPPKLLGDYGKIRQVLVNLVGNAIKFTENGGVIVGLSVVNEASGAWRLRCDVEDTGAGIPPEELDLIFDRYHRAEGVEATDGAGLGLAITKALVETMDGRISVASTLGEGSTFTFEIMLHEAAREGAEPRRVA